MPTLSIRLSDEEYTTVQKAIKVYSNRNDGPPTKPATVIKWLLLKWADTQLRVITDGAVDLGPDAYDVRNDDNK